MTTQILSRISNFKMKGLLTTWNQNLSESLDQILSLLEHTTAQTKSRNKTASEFLLQFDEY
jgi:hypothetical protein